jgi:glycosyltransferase domain-containing protein
MKNKITIVIPTHAERHYILLRAIDYYLQIGVSLIVVDASLEKLDDKYICDFNYLHMPNAPMGERMYKALCQVTTEFTCVSGDDDFLTETGLVKGANFLNENIDYVSVKGHNISFLKKTSTRIEQMIGQGAKVDSFNLDSDLIEDRVSNAYLTVHCYALHHTDMLLKCMSWIKNVKWEVAFERIIPIVDMCYGKHKILPVFWSARDREKYSDIRVYGDRVNKKVANAGVTHVISDFKSYLDTEDGKLFKNNFIEATKEVTSSRKKSEELFNSAFRTLFNLKGWYAPTVKKSPSLLAVIKMTVKKLLPKIIVNIYGHIRRYIVFRIKYQIYSWTPYKCQSANSDWKKITRAILKRAEVTYPNKIIN